MKPLYMPFASIVLLLCLSGALARTMMAQSKGPADAEKLWQEAQDLTDIRAQGSPSFRLTARLKAFDEKGRLTEGTYELLWKQPTSWQDDITLGPFSQTRVAVIDKLYIHRNNPSVPYEVFRLLRLMQFPDVLRLTKYEKIVKLREHGGGKIPERAIDVGSTLGSSKRIFYIDSSSPIPTGAAGYGDSRPLYLFQNYTDFDGHQFPRTLTEVGPKKRLFEIDVQELAKEDYGTSRFVPPPDSLWLQWCPHPTPAEYRGPESPHIIVFYEPPIGYLSYYAVIGTDGVLHNVTLTRSNIKEAASVWLRQWIQNQYLPAKCGEVPVEEEIADYLKFP